MNKLQKKEITSLLEQLVSIPSFESNSLPLAEYKLTKYIEKLFKDEFLSDFKLKRVVFESPRYNLLYQRGDKLRLLFACHLDTVSPSSTDATTLKVKGVKAYGLGTKDMKGGVVSTIIALRRLKETVGIPEGVGVLFYGDEETGFKGINKLVVKAKTVFSNSPEIIVSPESRFNLGIGARGIATMKVEIKGIRAHSARAHLGVDAIKELYLAVSRVETLLNKTRSPLGKTSVTISHIEGGLLETNGKIAVHTGSIPDIVRAVISIRNGRIEKSGSQILLDLTRLVEKEGATLKGEILEDFPARTTPLNVIRKVQKVIEKSGAQVPLADQKLAGFNDMAILANALNTYALNLGPYGEGNHTKDEWVDIRSIEQCSRVFISLIKAYTKQL